MRASDFKDPQQQLESLLPQIQDLLQIFRHTPWDFQPNSKESRIECRSQLWEQIDAVTELKNCAATGVRGMLEAPMDTGDSH
jgi:hypothetical protein